MFILFNSLLLLLRLNLITNVTIIKKVQENQDEQALPQAQLRGKTFQNILKIRVHCTIERILANI